MSEFYIESNSFAAPFCSDEGKHYVEAASPEEALEKMAANYKHPAGLYAAAAYTSSDARNKGEKPLAVWMSNRAHMEQMVTAGLGAFSFLGISPTVFEVNGIKHVVENPKEGAVRA